MVVRGLLLVRGGRQFNCEGGTFSNGTLDSNPAVVRFNNVSARGQTEPRTAFAGRIGPTLC